MTVLERIARAIYDALDKQQEYVGEYKFHDGRTCLDGDFDLIAAARAAVLAMREPTDEVEDAGWSEIHEDNHPAVIYRAMIDAILNEEKDSQ